MTTVRISDETWERLDDLKTRGDSFNDVIQRLLDCYEGQEATA